MKNEDKIIKMLENILENQNELAKGIMTKNKSLTMEINKITKMKNKNDWDYCDTEDKIGCDKLIEEFNKFIKKWCGNSFPHLIDSDDNDGERFRELCSKCQELSKKQNLKGKSTAQNQSRQNKTGEGSSIKTTSDNKLADTQITRIPGKTAQNQTAQDSTKDWTLKEQIEREIEEINKKIMKYKENLDFSDPWEDFCSLKGILEKQLEICNQYEKKIEKVKGRLKEEMQKGCGWEGKRYEKTSQRCTKHDLCKCCKWKNEQIDEVFKEGFGDEK